jgi:cytoskeletal protein CcmA (bactofilin family)
MTKQNQSDLKIYGKNSVPGGTFNDVIIAGEGKINGDLVCSVFKIHGDSKVDGSVKTISAKINGRTMIKGNLEADEFKINGSCEVGGNVSVKEIKVSGENITRGMLSAEKVEIRGRIKIEKDCNAEIFNSKGGFTINGLLNAGEIDIDLYAPCSAKEIGGEKINIKRGNTFSLRNLITSLFPAINLRDELITDSIEGDDIYLEWTKTKVVRGNNIVIGPGCEVDLVEYKKSFQQDKDSNVKSNKKV